MREEMLTQFPDETVLPALKRPRLPGVAVTGETLSATSPRSCGHSFICAAVCEDCARYLAELQDKRS